MGQWDIFKNYEGDNWYERNKEALKPKQDLITWLLDSYGILREGSAVLEVGASNGYRLEYIRQRYGCRAVAVGPSKRAVEEGKNSYPHIEFYNISAEEMDFKEVFDLVIINSVFHWIERANLLEVY
ncbi:MAG: class I SAM-dependent methyltransferase [Aquificaceae bacterium]